MARKSELIKQASKLTYLRYDISKDSDRDFEKEFDDLYGNQPKYRSDQPFLLETLNLNKSIVEEKNNNDQERENKVYVNIF
jgi:hypothetical protein